MQKRQTPETVSCRERARQQKAIDFVRGSYRYEGLVPTSGGAVIIQHFSESSLAKKQALAAMEVLKARTD